MRRARTALLLLLAACSKPLPPGVERLRAGEQPCAFSAHARRLACVQGSFPDRTYLVVSDLESGARTKRRLKGFVLGGGIALSRDGRRVLLDAGKLTDNAASRNEPTNRVVLSVDASDGSVRLEVPVGGAGAAALGHPAWSPDPIAVWNTKDGIRWSSLGEMPAGGLLEGPPAWRALLLDKPYLVVSEKQQERPRMSVYDLRDGRRAAEWRVALTGSPLSARTDGSALSARWMSETGTFVLEAGDPETGRRNPLIETDGEIEAAIETERGVYAVAKDPSRRNATGRDFMTPRVLLALEKDGKRWSEPWTSRSGRFFGADPADGRLLFAVTDRDRPGAWKIAPTRAALAVAGPAIDGL